MASKFTVEPCCFTQFFNNPVCLQGRVIPPCFGRVGGGPKRLFFYEHMLSSVSELTREGTIWESQRTWTHVDNFVVAVETAETCLSNRKDLYLIRSTV